MALEGKCKERGSSKDFHSRKDDPVFLVPEVSRLVIRWKGLSLLLAQATFLWKTDHEKELRRIKGGSHLVLNLGDHTHLEETGWHY